ncbi:MAG: hypothetical protein K0R55_1812 [Sporomusa sp.]|nr:hypothetical protein [Sporomusa sp.]
MGKLFVNITAQHDINGVITPILLNWENGRVFPIDKILDVRQAASIKAGGQGMRYTCMVASKQVYLFCDDGRWFIEK